MIEHDKIIRLAARGDGITQTGRHAPGAVPGDYIGPDGTTVVAGPHRTVPPCRHFEKCGGCQLQHADEEVLARFVADRVILAAAGQGVTAQTVLPTHLSPPRSRRRAVLHAQVNGKNVLLGFREAGSHRIVDMRECHIILPELFATVGPLRNLLRQHAGRAPVDVDLTATDQGIDCLIKGMTIEGYEAHEDLLDLAKAQKLARLSLDQGWGAETMWEPEPVTVTLGGVPVPFPAGAFSQATHDGEKVLQDDVMRYCGTSRAIADLFAGLGTLSLPLAAMGKEVALFEADQAAHFASRRALSHLNGSSQAVHRDLFRAPLQPDELKRFDTIVLDPPRAGAKAQVDALAKSRVDRIVYVSCNPASWARDAATLNAAGYRLQALRPVGQFRWSTHVELSSLFVR